MTVSDGIPFPDHLLPKLRHSVKEAGMLCTARFLQKYLYILCPVIKLTVPFVAPDVAAHQFKEVTVGMGTKAFLPLQPALFSTLPFSFPDAGLQNSA